MALQNSWNFIKTLSEYVKKEETQILEKKIFTTKKINSNVLKAENSFPEREEQRIHDLEENSFPEREEDDLFREENNVNNDVNVLMQNHKNEEETVENTIEKKDLTLTSVTIKKQNNYESLWAQTKPFFCTSIILEIKGSEIYLSEWSGRIQNNKTNEKIADLKDHSLFKVIQRGHPYHGFVVDLPANKKFFNNIGWDNISQSHYSHPYKK